MSNEIIELEYQIKTFKIHQCEIFSRVVGYVRPVNQWSDSKREEFKERALFDKAAK